MVTMATMQPIIVFQRVSLSLTVTAEDKYSMLFCLIEGKNVK